jgi:hypothetical protein
VADQEFPWEKDLLSLIHQPTPQEVEATRPPVPFIWEGRIPAGRVSIFSGAGGSGKSSLLVGLALARACGVRFLGKATRPGTTLVISAEDTIIDYMRKVDAWREVYRQLDPVAVARHLKILPLTGEDYRLVGGRFGSTYVERERVDRLAVAARMLDPRPDLIILETVSRFGAGDENSNEGAAALIAACERLSSIAESAVLPVAHVGKASAKEQNVDAYAARGASAFVDNARSALVLGTISPDRAKRLALTPEEARALLVLACPKANLAGRSADIVLERVETPHGLVLRPFDGGGMSDAEAVAVSVQAARQRHVENGRRLREVVASLTAAGVAVTGNLLRDEHRAATRWIPTRDYSEFIEQAVADKWLEYSVGSKRGRIVVPGPRTSETDGSVGSQPSMIRPDQIRLDAAPAGNSTGPNSHGNKMEGIIASEVVGSVGSSRINSHPDSDARVGSRVLPLKDPTVCDPTTFPNDSAKIGGNGRSSRITPHDPTPNGGGSASQNNSPNIPATPSAPSGAPVTPDLPWT